MTSTRNDSGYVAIVMTLLMSATALALYDAYTFLAVFAG